MITSDALPFTPHAQSSSFQQYFSPAEIDAFNFPLYEEFLRGPLFVCIASGALNMDALVDAHGDGLVRSAQFDIRSPRGHWETRDKQLLFKLAPDCWVFVDNSVSGCRVFARDHATAERTSREIVTRFRSRRRSRTPFFYVLKLDPSGTMTTMGIKLPKQARRTPQELALLYGPDFPEWERTLTDSLKTKRSGTIILRGPPGTGKTSFIRHLIDCLKSTHRFLYLPVTSFELLSAPRLSEFWSETLFLNRKLHKVVVLEDAEELLAEPDFGKRGNIANLLNIADGLLGDFLKVQLICTVNCDLDRLDPAIVRSGRLLAWREFPRIARSRAQEIAAHYDIPVSHQNDYSLADIFCGQLVTKPGRSRNVLGFASAP